MQINVHSPHYDHFYFHYLIPFRIFERIIKDHKNLELNTKIVVEFFYIAVGAQSDTVQLLVLGSETPIVDLYVRYYLASV